MASVTQLPMADSSPLDLNRYSFAEPTTFFVNSPNSSLHGARASSTNGSFSWLESRRIGAPSHFSSPPSSSKVSLTWPRYLVKAYAWTARVGVELVCVIRVG